MRGNQPLRWCDLGITRISTNPNWPLVDTLDDTDHTCSVTRGCYALLGRMVYLFPLFGAERLRVIDHLER